MVDVFTKEKRSKVMSRIRGKNTKPELEVFRYLRGNRIHFQRHYRKAAGSPDVAVPRKKLALFIDGDFWHGYRFSRWGKKLPSEFWRNKIQGNILRDKRAFARLRRNGWKVMRVWEHDLERKRRDVTFEKIRQFLLDIEP